MMLLMMLLLPIINEAITAHINEAITAHINDAINEAITAHN